MKTQGRAVTSHGGRLAVVQTAQCNPGSGVVIPGLKVVRLEVCGPWAAPVAVDVLALVMSGLEHCSSKAVLF